MDDLLEECVRMHKLDHPNILKLKGVCLDGGPAPFIILPFMENGSLRNYLIKERKNFLLNPEFIQPDDAVRVNYHFQSCHNYDHCLFTADI